MISHKSSLKKFNVSTNPWVMKEDFCFTETSNDMAMKDNSSVLKKTLKFKCDTSESCKLKGHLKTSKDGDSASNGQEKNNSTLRTSNYLRYKTELCRSFEENEFCRFGDGCTFAHGFRELRAVPRHPRYKTEACRTYHTLGYCQYGTRCHFVHDPDEMNGGSYFRNRSRIQQTDLNMSIFSVSPKETLFNNETIIANLWRLSALMQNNENEKAFPQLCHYSGQ